ncbi:MAG: preprotein translocase subunit SecG [bacterium]
MQNLQLIACRKKLRIFLPVDCNKEPGKIEESVLVVYTIERVLVWRTVFISNKGKYAIMQNAIYIVLSVVSVLIVIFVLLQERGGELGRTFGGGGGFYRSRRGLEKLLFQATVVCGVIFIAFSLFNTLTQQ